MNILKTVLLVTAVSLTAATGASAQYYGGDYGYNNGRPNSYGDFGRDNYAPRNLSPGTNSFYQNRIAPSDNSSYNYGW